MVQEHHKQAGEVQEQYMMVKMVYEQCQLLCGSQEQHMRGGEAQEPHKKVQEPHKKDDEVQGQYGVGDEA